jgi:TM2 domain-containing membrane protein YozV
MSIFSEKRTPTRPSGDPTVATLLTWFIPGAGHLYLGRTTFALVAFVLVEGVFLLGIKLSDGMGFEFLQDELRTLLGPALAPEAGNLGGLLYQIRGYGYGPGSPRPFPDFIALGSALTALSGVLNVCLMCHAHFEARLAKGITAGRKSPALAVLLTWCVPGLGHLYQGRRARGVIVFVALVGLLVVGILLAETSNLSRERHYYYWGGQFMIGLPSVIAELVWGARPMTSHVHYAEAGLVFGTVAGLLNILSMLDVYGWSEKRWFEPKLDAGEVAA